MSALVVSRETPLLRPSALLTCLAVTLLFMLSSMVLFQLGLAYEAPGGSPLEKMHPGSLVAFLALGCLCLERGPLRLLDSVIARAPLLVPYLATWGLLLLHMTLVLKVPFTPIIDTFLLPVAIFLLTARLEGSAARVLALLLHLGFTANALIGLAEFLTGWRLTPYVAGGLLITDDWRSTALLGHPLVNACLTGCYVITLAGGGGRDLPGWLRAPLIGLQLAAMVAFGGRAALVLLILALAVQATGRVVAILSGARFSLAPVALAACILPALCVGVMMLGESGFFDRLATRFVSDNGSAKTRLAMFELFDDFTFEQLAFGPDPALLSSVARAEGLEYGIESFWVAFILSYGFIVSAIFFCGLACFCFELARASRPSAVLAILFFFAVASFSVSLSAKGCVFALFTAVVLVLLRPEEAKAG